MTDLTRDRSATLWVAVLTAAGTAVSLVLACATPFPALAAMGAAYMNRRANVALALAAWGASQLVGFCKGDYPVTPGAFGWAAGIGVAAVVGALAAQGTAAKAKGEPLRLVLGYVAAFAAFKLAILGWGMVKGDLGHAMSLEILTRQFVRNGAILLGLVALYRGLTAAGVPTARRALA
jgi:hypothetical protein